jgi:hypothetical protein
MASRLDSTRVHGSPAQDWHPVIPALTFVGLVALVNGALNGMAAGLGSVLPPALQFEYTVTVPLSPLGAGVVFVSSGILMVCSLAVFVRSVCHDRGSEPRSVSTSATLQRFGRATGVAVAGVLALALGLALFVIPGLVVLVYLPFVFVAVVRDGRSLLGAIKTSHTRIAGRPVAVAVTALGTALSLVGIGLIGVFTRALPPTAEFVIGGASSAVVVLVGMYLLTMLYQRLPSQTSSMNTHL